MTIAIGSDHRGYRAKVGLVCLLENLGHDVVDFGCYGIQPVDYPDVARPLAAAVGSQRFDLGILIDDTGVGMCMVANKVHGVRAAIAYDEFTARCIREHHHCNVLCLGADLDADNQFARIVNEFLRATAADGRHARRVQKIIQMEQMMAASPDATKMAAASITSNEGHGLSS